MTMRFLPPLCLFLCLAAAAGCSPEARVEAPSPPAAAAAFPRAAGTADGWSVPAPIAAWEDRLAPTDRHRLADLAADRRGRLHAVFTRGHGPDGAAGGVLYAGFDGRAWTAPAALAGPSRAVHLLRVAADTAGHPHVLWLEQPDSTAGRGRVALVHRTHDGRGWSPAREVYREPEPGPPGSPTLAVAAGCDGTLHVVHSSTRRGLVHRARTASGWGSPSFLDHVGLTAEWAAAARCPAPLDLVYMGSADDPGPGRSVNDLFARPLRGGRWGALRRLHGAAGRYSHFPLLLVDARGVRHAVWLEDTNGTLVPEAIFHATSADGATWSPARDVTPPGLRGGVFWMVRGAVDAAGRLHLVARFSRAASPEGSGVYALRRERGAWSVPAVLAPEGALGEGEARVAAAGDGVHALWRGRDGRYYHSVWSPPRAEGAR